MQTSREISLSIRVLASAVGCFWRGRELRLAGAELRQERSRNISCFWRVLSSAVVWASLDLSFSTSYPERQNVRAYSVARN